MSTNCTACFTGPQWQLGYHEDDSRYTCIPTVAVSLSFACSVAEESPAGTGVACPPLPTGVALSLSPLTQLGAGHSFILNTLSNGSVIVAVGPAVVSLPLDYSVAKRYNVTLSVCVPQAIAGFSAPGIPAAYAVCEAALHADTSATLTIDLSPINKPPVFTLPSLSFSTPGVASVGDTIGFPLSLYAVNPNTVAPWSTLTFSIAVGLCGARANQSLLPFAVVPGNGSLVYTSAVSAWFTPLFACATATNGGGLNASINVTVTFTAVAARLSVFPTAIAVTHYALGVSSSSASVSLYVGTQAGLTWEVGNAVGAPWLLGVKASDTALALSVNSSRLGLNWRVAPMSAANVTLSTSGE
ncbi:MAG: hypothetical protein P4L87_10810 [Formivibrio sp.]|nr:hypothetical protein [Formivibrio sp.]